MMSCIFWQFLTHPYPLRPWRHLWTTPKLNFAFQTGPGRPGVELRRQFSHAERIGGHWPQVRSGQGKILRGYTRSEPRSVQGSLDIRRGVPHKYQLANTKTAHFVLKIAKKHKHFFFFLLLTGDVILREEPYAAVLEPIFRVNHCSHCLRKTSTPIPCFECATVRPILLLERVSLI